MAELKLPYGNSDFKTIREKGYYYIDKTSFISEVIRDSAITLLFTRPRRFGKTTLMTTLASFFDIREENRAYFSSLNIEKDSLAISDYLNQYPVIYITLKDVAASNFDEALIMLKKELFKLYSSYDFIFSEETPEIYKSVYEELKSGSLSIFSIMLSLSNLTELLSSYYSKRVIILIDEYDVPLAKAESGGYYDQMLNLLLSLFSVLKDESHVEKAILTGCLRVSKESLFTGLNNFASYSLLVPGYSKYFGFTEKEVDTLLDASGLSELKDRIKLWYDGYLIGKDSIYSSWDVISYVQDVLKYGTSYAPQNYWVNTSENEIIRRFIDKTDASISEELSTLLSGKAVYLELSESFTYNDIYREEKNIWSLLFETGYLTLSAPYIPNEANALSIPNEEIKNLFVTTVNSWFLSTVKKEDRSALFDALFSQDERKLEEIITDHLERTISYYDYKEDFYHAFVAGLFSSPNFVVKSNRESGLGRYDLSIVDNREKKAAIVEFKAVKDKKEIEKALENALKQIDINKYDINTERYKLSVYAMVFYKKSAYVKARENLDSL